MVGGSGYYKVIFEPAGIAKVQHLTQNQTVQVRIHRIKESNLFKWFKFN